MQNIYSEDIIRSRIGIVVNRLKDIYGLRGSEIEDALDIAKNSLSRYIHVSRHSRNPLYICPALAVNYGISLNWLVLGIGDMFLRTDQGIDFREKYFKYMELDLEKIEYYTQLRNWVFEKYKSLDNFAKIVNIPYKKVYSYIEEENPLPSSFTKLILREGFEYIKMDSGNNIKINNNDIEKMNDTNNITALEDVAHNLQLVINKLKNNK